jgi:hypothetical protein
MNREEEDDGWQKEVLEDSSKFQHMAHFKTSVLLPPQATQPSE